MSSPLLHSISRATAAVQRSPPARGRCQRKRFYRRVVFGKIGVQTCQMAAQRLGCVGRTSYELGMNAATTRIRSDTYPQLCRDGARLNRIVSAHPFAQPVNLRHGLRDAAMQHEDELIAAPAPDGVCGAAYGSQLCGELLQQLIASQMTIFVIHPFELVNVDDGDAKWSAGLEGLLDLSLHGEPAAEAGERIAGGNLFSLFQPGLIGRDFSFELVDCGVALGGHPVDRGLQFRCVLLDRLSNLRQVFQIGDALEPRRDRGNLLGASLIPLAH